MKTIQHMCADIEGLLRNRGKDSLKGLLVDKKTGRHATDAEAREYLQRCLDKGWRVLPCTECDNFDYQTGCKGHVIEEDVGQ